MSKNFCLICVSHHGPIRSDNVGQHSYDLPGIREVIANKDALLGAFDLVDYKQFFYDSGKNNALAFLSEHRNCALEIMDEYGQKYPLVDPEPKEIRRSPLWSGANTVLGKAKVESKKDGTLTVIFTELTDEGRVILNFEE